MATIGLEGTSTTATVYSNQTFTSTVDVTSNSCFYGCDFTTQDSNGTAISCTTANTTWVHDNNFIYMDSAEHRGYAIHFGDNQYTKRQFCHPEYGIVSIWASKNATEKEVRELLEHEYSNIRNRREQNKLSEVAEIKAQDLLKDFIGEEELKVYNETGRLYVKGEKGEYIVRRGSTIQKIEGNKVIDFCVHLKNRGHFPPTDNVIALKFLLEEDENKVLKLANKRGSTSFDSIEELPLAACM